MHLTQLATAAALALLAFAPAQLSHAATTGTTTSVRTTAGTTSVKTTTSTTRSSTTSKAAVAAATSAAASAPLVQTYGSCTMNGALAHCLDYQASRGCRYSEYERCTTLDTLRKKIDCYCGFFQRQADCWGQGRCCTEWPAHASAAKEVCAYAKLPDSQLDAAKMKTMRTAAYDVVMQTCNNDCQTDIPCRDDEPMPVNGQNPKGFCQPRTYWANGKCTGRQMCASYDRIKRKALATVDGEEELAPFVDTSDA